jgi:hypothetical protein
MKAKTLLISAATLAAGVMASQAAVYSQNIVGYINVTIPAGQFCLIQNPLSTGNDVLTNVIPLGNVPKNTEAYFFAAGSFGAPYQMTKTGWSPDASTVSVAPGQGFFIQNTAVTNFTLTLVGTVLSSNSAPVALSPGFNLVGAPQPVSGFLQTQMGVPAVKNDFVYQFNDGGGNYYPETQATKTGWSPSEPYIGTNVNVGVAEAFFYDVNGATTENWTNSLSPY